MIDSTVYVPGHGEGVIDAVCNDTPGSGLRKYSYLVIFGKGDRTYRKWVEASKAQITGAVQPKVHVKSSYQEGE